MRDRGFAQPEQLGDVADAQLGAGERVEDPHAGDVAEDLEGFGERDKAELSASSVGLRYLNI